MIYYIDPKEKRNWLHDVMSFGVNSLFEDVDHPRYYVVCLRFKHCPGKWVGGIAWDEYEGELIVDVDPKQSKEQLIRTIFHEMVHLRQMVTGRYDPEHNLWDNIIYTCEYRKLPWEIEAFELEDELYHAYCNLGGRSCEVNQQEFPTK